MSQKHNLWFSGASPDNRVTYRISGGATKQTGNIPDMSYNRLNLQGKPTAQVTNWLSTDLVISYSYATNNQPFKGVCGTPATCVGGGPCLASWWPRYDRCARLPDAVGPAASDHQPRGGQRSR